MTKYRMTYFERGTYRIERRVCFIWIYTTHICAGSIEDAKKKFDEWLTLKSCVMYGEVK